MIDRHAARVWQGGIIKNETKGTEGKMAGPAAWLPRREAGAVGDWASRKLPLLRAGHSGRGRVVEGVSS